MRRLFAAAMLCAAFTMAAHADDWDRANNMRPEYSHMLGAVPGHPLASEEARVERRAHHTDGSAGSRPRAWCGWWMGLHKGIHDRALWLAANWAHVGQAASGPAPGVIGVERHHVYEVIAVTGKGRVLAISGNDGHAVRTRERSTARTIAWRRV